MRGETRRGFTLTEVIIALGIFVFGAVSLAALFVHNTRTVYEAKMHTIAAVLQRDLVAKHQLAAYFASKKNENGKEVTTFDCDDWLLVDPGALSGGKFTGSGPWPQTWSNIRTEYDKYCFPGEQFQDNNKNNRRDPDEIYTDGELRRNPPDGNADGIRNNSFDQGLTWEQNELYRGFQFRVEPFPVSKLEANQYMDFDGYGKIKEEEIGVDLDGDGKLASAPDFGVPRPSHRVTYHPEEMRYYEKRLKLLIGWDLLRPGLADDQEAKNGIYSGKRHLLYFSLRNPDTRKH